VESIELFVQVKVHKVNLGYNNVLQIKVTSVYRQRTYILIQLHS
jgi:hypothetical protein